MQSKKASYGKANPPASREQAIFRLETLSFQIERIAIQLETWEPDHFETDNDFFTWQHRATGALAHLRTERNYLTRWLNLGSVVKQNIGGLATVTARAGEILSVLNGMYTPKYHEDRMPASFEEAFRREQELLTFMQEFFKFFAELKALAKENGVGERTIKKLRAPIYDLQQVVLAESRLVRSVADQHGHVVLTGARWTELLTQIIDRAVGQGFALLPQEEEVVERIRARNAING